MGDVSRETSLILQNFHISFSGLTQYEVVYCRKQYVIDAAHGRAAVSFAR